MTGTDKQHLVTNIVSQVKAGVKPEVIPRVIEYWSNVYPQTRRAGSKAANGG
jgi:hypothetical protein